MQTGGDDADDVESESPVAAARINLPTSPVKTAAYPEYSLLSLNNDVEYDNTRCTWLCCIEEFK